MENSENDRQPDMRDNRFGRKKELVRLMDRINQQIQYGSVIIDKPVHNDLVNMMKDHTDEVLHKHGEDLFCVFFGLSI